MATYYSYEEYKKKFFPQKQDEDLLFTNPKELGRIMAEEAIEKYKHILEEKC